MIIRESSDVTDGLFNHQFNPWTTSLLEKHWRDQHFINNRMFDSDKSTMEREAEEKERLSPEIKPEPLKVPALRSSILQTGASSAFRRVSPHTSPRREHNADSPGSQMDSSNRTIDYSVQRRCHSESCGSVCTCRTEKSEKDQQETTVKNEDVSTPAKPRLSFSVEAIMSSKTSPSSSHQQHSQQQYLHDGHVRSRDSSFSSDRHKENCSPATSGTSEASSLRESEMSPMTPPLPPTSLAHPAHRDDFPGLGPKSAVAPAQLPPPPHHLPFLGTPRHPDGWPWLTVPHHPAPAPISKLFSVCSHFFFGKTQDLIFLNFKISHSVHRSTFFFFLKSLWSQIILFA